MDAFTFSIYLIIFIIGVNAVHVMYEHCTKPAPIEYDTCTEGKCKNESFKNTPFCYWHHPLRRIFYPLGSELRPRRSQRIAHQRGGYYTLNMD